MPLEESARVCLPDAVRIHIKDGRMERGNVKFLLPGEGNLSLWNGKSLSLWNRSGEGSINGIGSVRVAQH